MQGKTQTPDAGLLDAAQVVSLTARLRQRAECRLVGEGVDIERFKTSCVEWQAADALAALSQQLSDARAWKPIETYDREKGETATLLDWFTYRTDPDKKPNPVRYVGAWSAEHEAWFDDDGMDLDIDPTHWLPLPNVPEGGR